MEGIDSGFVAYPWFIEEHEFEGIGGSFSAAAAETDPTLQIGTRYKTETILSEIPGRLFQITLYGYAVHGLLRFPLLYPP